MKVCNNTDELTNEIRQTKEKVENILKSYPNDAYAALVADELTETLVQLERANIKLKYAKIRGLFD